VNTVAAAMLAAAFLIALAYLAMALTVNHQ
jgi:hypothetical protein